MSTATPVRVTVIGTGVVGAWLLRAIARHRDELRDREGIDLTVTGIANRGGFIHAADGLELGRLLASADLSAAVASEPAHRWPTALDGLEATSADVVVEVTQSPADDGEPGLSHIRHALARGVPVVTSNKWPVALGGVALSELAARHRTELRAESTVMSGTPALAALAGGIGLAGPLALTGIVNAAVNTICTDLMAGTSYADAVAAAQRAGLTEPDPSEDLDGHDSTAKLMILSALVFGHQLTRADVRREGLSTLGDELLVDARRRGDAIREVIELEPRAGIARVAMRALSPEDPLSRVSGTENAIRLSTDVMEPIAVTGPGAGPHLAGQGVFADLIAVVREQRRREPTGAR